MPGSWKHSLHPDADRFVVVIDGSGILRSAAWLQGLGPSQQRSQHFVAQY
jgi:hypothetical protein